MTGSSQQPLSKEKMMQNKNENGYIEGKVMVHLSDIIDNDLEGFLDLLSEKLIGSPLLMDINYDVVDSTAEVCIIIKVRGDVPEILEK